MDLIMGNPQLGLSWHLGIPAPCLNQRNLIMIPRRKIDGIWRFGSLGRWDLDSKQPLRYYDSYGI